MQTIEFVDSLDIANRALDWVGQPPIETVTEDSTKNEICSRVYGKLRTAELRRNTWRFSTKRVILRPLDTTTYLLDPVAWSATTTYLPGAIVSDSNGALWYSLLSGENHGNEPGTTSAWDRYFGPVTVHLYDSTTSYWAGELVYKSLGSGKFVIFMSLSNSNTSDPATADAYDATVTYHKGEAVSYLGSQWYSLIEVNVGNTPAEPPTAYDPSAIYAAGNQVTATDGFIYTCINNNTTGHSPTDSDTATYWTATGTPAAWSAIPTQYAASRNWRPIFAGMMAPNIQYPIGAGPVTQQSTRNIYHLPAGYLKRAPQSPKAGAFNFLGASASLPLDDWEFEGDYIVTTQTGATMFRFVADVVDVSKMDPMFCEGLACAMAMVICEPLTQSASKIQTVASAYKKTMGEARLANAIEVDPVQPPEDEFITVRM